MLEQFFRRDKNEVLFKLFSIILDSMCHPRSSANHKGKQGPRLRFMHYQQICDLYNRQYKTSNKKSQNKEEKLKTVDVAGYCKKLMKLGFLNIENHRTSSEKFVSLKFMQPYWENYLKASKAKADRDPYEFISESEIQAILST